MNVNPRVRSPEFPKNFVWLNTNRPLSVRELKGRLILLDFWTYCCINCLHILPNLKHLEQKYKQVLTILGVHSAKFENENEIDNIRQAILRYDIEHPVIVDQNFKIWHDYVVRAWPTLVLIDPDGYVIGKFAGEGNFKIINQLIDQLTEQYQETGKISVQEIHFTLEKYHQPLISPLAFPGKVLATPEQLFIADSGYHRLVISTLNGEVLQVIGNGQPALVDGDFETAQFSAPQGMTFDAENQILYVADTENHAIRKVDLNRHFIETIAGTSIQSRILYPHCGIALETCLNSPWDLQLINHCLYIAMAGAHQIWQMQLATSKISTYAGNGREFGIDGNLLEATFAQPSGITTNGKELLIADSEISSIRGVGLGENAQVRTLCGSGELFGFGDQDGTGNQVRLQHCLGVEYAAGYLWVADTYNHKIKQVDTATGVCLSWLGDGVAGFKNGQGLQARFCEPSGLSSTAEQLYIADTNNHVIRRVELATMTVTTLQFSGLCSPNLCVPSNPTNH
jgi:thiol-disulfide isomerase/thioredoxin